MYQDYGGLTKDSSLPGTGEVISQRNSVNDNDTKTVATVGLSCCSIQFIIQVIDPVIEYIISRVTEVDTISMSQSRRVKR